MSQCKTLANLHRKMADVYDFCKGTAFEGKEYLCVKYKGYVCTEGVPSFAGASTNYEFALGIVEDKPVWEGDRLYYAGKLAITKGEDFFTGLAKPYWSWNPPAPPKPKTVSIVVNGGEPIMLVLPDGTSGADWHWHISIGNKLFSYKKEEDASAAIICAQNLLEGKCDEPR